MAFICFNVFLDVAKTNVEHTLYGVASVAPGAITVVADVVVVAIVVCVVIVFCQVSVGAVADDAAGVAAAGVGWLVGVVVVVVVVAVVAGTSAAVAPAAVPTVVVGAIDIVVVFPLI